MAEVHTGTCGQCNATGVKLVKKGDEYVLDEHPPGKLKNGICTNAGETPKPGTKIRIEL